MLGLYRLNDRQAAIYQDFVEMLSEMDTHDAVCYYYDVNTYDVNTYDANTYDIKMLRC